MAEKAGLIEVQIFLDTKRAVDGLKEFSKEVKTMAKRVTRQARKVNAEFAKIKPPVTKQMVKEAKQVTESLKKQEKQAKATTLTFAKLGAAYFVVSRGVRTFINTAQKGADLSLKLAEIATLTDEGTFSMREQEKIVRSLSDAYGEKFITTAPALYDAISAGATDAASANRLMASGIVLAIGTVSEQKQAVSLLSGVLNAYGDEVGGAAEVTDDFFAIVRQGKLVLEDLDPALGRVTPLAKSAGLAFKEVGATIVALTRAGSSASEAITKLRSILNASIKKQGDFDSAMQRIGLRFDSNTFKTRGFIQTLQDLSRSVGGSQEKLGKLLGRVEGLTGLLSLTDDQARLYNEAMHGMVNSTGLADQAVAELRDSTGRKFEEIKNAAANMATGIGDSIAGMVVEIAEAITKIESFEAARARLAGGGVGSPSRDRAAAAVLDPSEPGRSSVDLGTFFAGSFEPPKELSSRIDAIAASLDKLAIARNALGESGKFFGDDIVGEGAAKRAVVTIQNFSKELDGIVVDIPVRVSEEGLETEFLKLFSTLIQSAGDLTEEGLVAALSSDTFDPIVGAFGEGLALSLDRINIADGIISASLRDVSTAEAEATTAGIKVATKYKAAITEGFEGTAEEFSKTITVEIEKASVEVPSLTVGLGLDELIADLGDLSSGFEGVNLAIKEGSELLRGDADIAKDKRASLAAQRDAQLQILAVASDTVRAEKRSLEARLLGVTGISIEAEKERALLKIRIDSASKHLPLLKRTLGVQQVRTNLMEKDVGALEATRKELEAIQEEFAVLSRSVGLKEAFSLGEVDKSATRELEQSQLRVIQLNSELNSGISDQTSLIQANRAASISSLTAQLGKSDELDASIERQIALLKRLSNADVRAARVQDAQRLISIEGANLVLLAKTIKGRGQELALARAKATVAVQGAEAELAAMIQQEPHREKEIEALKLKVELLRLAGGLAVEEAALSSGQLGFWDSLSVSMDKAAEDFESLGDLGREVGDSIGSMTASWVQSLDEGGNAWESFQDQVLQGLIDIALQWAIMGLVGTIAGGVSSAAGSFFGDGVTSDQKPKEPASETRQAASQLSSAGGEVEDAAVQLSGSSDDLESSGITLFGASIAWLVVSTQIQTAADSLLAAASIQLAAAAVSTFADGGIMQGSMISHGSLPVNAYAGGGVASTPQIAIFGEGKSKAEAFVPLPDGKNIPVVLDMGGFQQTANELQMAVASLNAARNAHLPQGGGAGQVMNVSTTTIVMEVDARGSNDPVATEAAFDRSLARSMPLIEKAIGSSMQSGRSSVLVSGARQAARRG